MSDFKLVGRRDLGKRGADFRTKSTHSKCRFCLVNETGDFLCNCHLQLLGHSHIFFSSKTPIMDQYEIGIYVTEPQRKRDLHMKEVIGDNF